MRHQHNFHCKLCPDLQFFRVAETDATLADDDRARLADIFQQALCNRLAEEVEALVNDLQVAGQRAVALTDMAQHVLRLEVEQVQFTEQIEHSRAAHKWLLRGRFGGA